jgi:hypothetical protein
LFKKKQEDSASEITLLENQIAEYKKNHIEPEGGMLALEENLAKKKASYAEADKIHTDKRLADTTKNTNDLKTLEDALAAKKEALAKQAFLTNRRVAAAQIAINAIEAGIKVAASTGNPVAGAAVGVAGLGLATAAASIDYETGAMSWKGLMDTFGAADKQPGATTEQATAGVTSIINTGQTALAGALPASAGKLMTLDEYFETHKELIAPYFAYKSAFTPAMRLGPWTTLRTAGFPQAFLDGATTAYVPMADGGIVKASPGGTRAIIGEGKYDEAVIPLKKGMSMGQTINVYVQGSILRERDLDGIIGNAMAKTARGY